METLIFFQRDTIFQKQNAQCQKKLKGGTLYSRTVASGGLPWVVSTVTTGCHTVGLKVRLLSFFHQKSLQEIFGTK